MSEVKVNKISPRTNCGTVQLGDSGDTITIPSGATITNSGTAAGFGSTGEVSWNTTIKTGDFTATSGSGFFVNTGSGAVTVTLPSSPSAGNVVAVSDYNSTAGTNNITIARNGSNINGAASNLTITKANSAIQLIYVDSTTGWQSVATGNISDISNPFLSASGGTETTSGNFKIHTFTGPGTFTVNKISDTVADNVVSYIVVGGGASGGHSADNEKGGGGGGAGGFRENKGSSDCYPASPLDGSADITVTATSFPITVGAGGAAPPNSANPGSNSVFSTVTSAGGGYGAFGTGGSGGVLHNGAGGGSGGGSTKGGSGGSGNTPPVSPAQGQNGGSAAEPAGESGGGGGGATAVGANVPGTNDGGGADGGAGATTSISGSATAYAGGGGGGTNGAPFCNSPEANALGGSGGTGGRSQNDSGKTAGTANTGGGGGGAGGLTPGATAGAAGGSGVVIIRYKFQ
jgi:hypothetical protein